MLIKCIDGVINSDREMDYHKIYEEEMSDEGYINLTTERQFDRLKEKNK